MNDRIQKAVEGLDRASEALRVWLGSPKVQKQFADLRASAHRAAKEISEDKTLRELMARLERNSSR